MQYTVYALKYLPVLHKNSSSHSVIPGEPFAPIFNQNQALGFQSPSPLFLALLHEHAPKNAPPHSEAVYFTGIEPPRSLPHLLARTYTPWQAWLRSLSPRDTPDHVFEFVGRCGLSLQKCQADRIPHAVHQFHGARVICRLQRVTGRLGPGYGQIFDIW